jgi:multiple sugar transport system substrate-binding protein
LQANEETRLGIALRGMTWSHPRGYDPLVACAEVWRETTGVAIAWDKRSLQDFEAYPVEDLARRYDLIVIDHPHVGQITREGCLTPFDDPARAPARKALERASVGPSYAS